MPVATNYRLPHSSWEKDSRPWMAPHIVVVVRAARLPEIVRDKDSSTPY